MTQPRKAKTTQHAAVNSARFDREAKAKRLDAEIWIDGFVRVSSASRPAEWNLVSVEVLSSGRFEFGCDHECGTGFGTGPVYGTPGHTPCTHAAAAADLLERLGVACWDGVAWRALDVLPR